MIVMVMDIVEIAMVKCINVKNAFTEEEMLENIDDAGLPV
jgi:hypothetical protein